MKPLWQVGCIVPWVHSQGAATLCSRVEKGMCYLFSQVLQSQQMASAVKLSQQYGPTIAAQALQAVSSLLLSNVCMCWWLSRTPLDVKRCDLLTGLISHTSLAAKTLSCRNPAKQSTRQSDAHSWNEHDVHEHHVFRMLRTFYRPKFWCWRPVHVLYGCSQQ